MISGSGGHPRLIWKGPDLTGPEDWDWDKPSPAKSSQAQEMERRSKSSSLPVRPGSTVTCEECDVMEGEGVLVKDSEKQ